jgi:hypothetical protein
MQMKMKHCDMPMLANFTSPHSLPTRAGTTSNSVGDHLQRFLLLSKETADHVTLEAPSVRDYLDPEDRQLTPKPRSTSNQSAKQVRFDIKHGLMELIRDTKLDIVNKKPRAASQVAKTTRAPNRRPSLKEALRMALNYKRDAI